MSSGKTDLAATERREIARLVGKARTEGEPDVFFGKRQWRRYQLGLPLEVTTGGGKVSDTWASVMHNISGGGFGFWSKRALAENESIFVREWGASSAGEWLPARVTHCTVGIQGYLIGARFENPCSADDDFGQEVSEEELSGSDESPGPLNHPSLRVKSSLTCAFAAGMGVAATNIAIRLFSPNEAPPWSLAVVLLFACGVGALFGYLIGAGEAQFLEAFRVAIRKMGKGGAVSTALPDAPSKELAALRRAFLDLGAGWRRREDDERAQRQRLEELTRVKTNILSIVSHDLRTPLTSILLYAQMLDDELTTLTTEDQRHFLQIISDECNRLSRLVDDLLEVQRLEADRVQWDIRPQDLASIIRSCARVFEAMARSKSIQFTMDCPDALPRAQADADKISQVMSNLLSNALKYTPNGGGVRVSAEARGQEILLCVSDTGPGIPRDKWDQIFDRFSQLGDPNVSEIDGFGLGLYIVKRIVEHHGGAAWVDSEVGEGSQFYVSLPMQVNNSRSENLKKVSAPIGCVLVCDPDPELAASMARTLSWHNYEVRVCHSGRRLLAQLAPGDLDVVITDVLLPDMNSSEVLDALAKSRDRRFSVIVHSFSGDSTEFSRYGVDVFLRRPVSGDELVKAVEVAMQRHRHDGLTLLLVNVGDIDMTPFESLFAEKGHLPLVAHTVEAAGHRIRDYSVDAVLIPCKVLSDDWSALDDWRVNTQGPLDFFVLGETFSKRDRRLADEFGATLLVYRPEHKEQIIDTVAASESVRLLELTS